MAALLIGATGMLDQAARAITAGAPDAKPAKTVLIARHASSRMVAERTIPLDADWSDAAGFAGALEKAASHGPFDLALLWMHPRAPTLRSRIAQMIAEGGMLVEVFGSRASRPGAIADQRLDAMHAMPHVVYRQVRLGFVIEDGTSRWLTHTEISRAALAALEAHDTVVEAGRHEPWEARPAPA